MRLRKLSGYLMLLSWTASSVISCTSPANTEGAAPNMTSADPTQLVNQLQAKPSLEAVQGEYRGLVEQIANHIVALIPGMTWKTEQDTWDGCGGVYAGTNAKSGIEVGRPYGHADRYAVTIGSNSSGVAPCMIKASAP